MIVFNFIGTRVSFLAREALAFVLLLTVTLAAPGFATAAAPGPSGWSSFLHPFAVDSPWNSRPVSPKLDVQVVPPSQFPPGFAEGAFSTGVFMAQQSDGPVTVTGLSGSQGLYDADAETFHDMTIPHWPSDVVPAAGSDGHADIVDTASGVIHSFFQLRNVGGQWRATQYAWTPLDGRGWGDPAHYFQGSRAAGVTPTAGLIRKHEVADGDSMYRHALAMSLTSSGLASNPTYVFPATSADTNAAASNTGTVPEGALMMLPYGFDAQRLTTQAARKVAQTLKVYGAYVVDRNAGVPFLVYAENGTGLGAQNNAVAADMEKIRVALRRVTSVRSWLDGNNGATTPNTNLNLLSMRGTWQTQSGSGQGNYDTLAQAVLMPATPGDTVLVNFSNRALSPLLWAVPAAGTPHKLTAVTTGGARLRVRLFHPTTSAPLFDSGELENGESITFPWPAVYPKTVLNAISSGTQASSVGAELIRAD